VAAEIPVAGQLTRIPYSAQGEAVVDDRRVALHAMLYDPPITGPNPLGLFEAGDLPRPWRLNCGQQIVPFRGLDGDLSRDGDGKGAAFVGAHINHDICG